MRGILKTFFRIFWLVNSKLSVNVLIQYAKKTSLIDGKLKKAPKDVEEVLVKEIGVDVNNTAVRELFKEHLVIICDYKVTLISPPLDLHKLRNLVDQITIDRFSSVERF